MSIDTVRKNMQYRLHSYQFLISFVESDNILSWRERAEEEGREKGGEEEGEGVEEEGGRKRVGVY